MPRVAISGSDGFAGRHILDRLRQDGVEVVPIELRDPVCDPVRGVNVLVHLAARSSKANPGSLRFENDSVYASNILATERAIKFCRSAGCGMIFVSTYLYGFDSDVPANEDAEIIIANEYQRSKWDSEDLCRRFHDESGLPVTILRASNFYGPGQSRSFVIPRIVAEALSAVEVRIENGSARRDFIFISDFADLVLEVSKKQEGLRVFNAGSGVLSSLRLVAETLAKVLGPSARFRISDVPRVDDLVRPLDCSRVLSATSWRPRVDLEAGLRKLVAT